MKKVLAVLMLLALVFVFSYGQAAEMKIGYIDFEKAFNEYYRTKTEDAKLKKELEDAEAGLEKKAFEISKLRDKMELLGEDARKKKEKELREQIQGLNEMRTKTRDELVEKRNKKWLEIYDEIKEVAAKYAKENSYTLIFDEKALIYKEATGDVTAEIVTLLNKGQK